MNPKAIIQGLSNYKKDTDIPKHILESISKCKHNVDAPILALRLNDRYKETDGKICNKCYCPQPTKTRQSIEKCPCWNQ